MAVMAPIEVRITGIEELRAVVADAKATCLGDDLQGEVRKLRQVIGIIIRRIVRGTPFEADEAMLLNEFLWEEGH
jgi:glycerate-2-kinase